jgi:hypothetical protein
LWFVAAFFGATTLEIVVARANQPPGLFLAFIRQKSISENEMRFSNHSMANEKRTLLCLEDHSPMESLTVNW